MRTVTALLLWSECEPDFPIQPLLGRGKHADWWTKELLWLWMKWKFVMFYWMAWQQWHNYRIRRVGNQVFSLWSVLNKYLRRNSTTDMVTKFKKYLLKMADFLHPRCLDATRDKSDCGIVLNSDIVVWLLCDIILRPNKDSIILSLMFFFQIC